MVTAVRDGLVFLPQGGENARTIWLTLNSAAQSLTITTAATCL